MLVADVTCTAALQGYMGRFDVLEEAHSFLDGYFSINDNCAFGIISTLSFKHFIY